MAGCFLAPRTTYERTFHMYKMFQKSCTKIIIIFGETYDKICRMMKEKG